MTTITTHVLDTARGLPAAGVGVVLEAREGAPDLAAVDVAAGVHRLVFATGDHLGEAAFYPEVTVVVEVRGEDHLHVPLLLAPYGYSTYRGS